MKGSEWLLLASSKTRDLMSGTFQRTLLDALGFMDWMFRRTMEEYRSFESLERDGTAVLELDETVVEEEPVGTAEGLYFLQVVGGRSFGQEVEWMVSDWTLLLQFPAEMWTALTKPVI